MVEPWTALGVSLLKDLVFQEVLLKLGKDALEDYVKDFFKDCIKGGVESAKPNVLKKALGESLQQFLRIVQDQLELNCDISGAEIRDDYEIRIGEFIRNQQVKPLLGKAFEKDCRRIDGTKLGAIWLNHYPPAMPMDFDWDGVAKEYVKEAKRIVKQSPELRAILELEIKKAIEESTREIAGIIPDFNLKTYQEGLRERYGNLKLDSLDTTGCAYNELKLWQVFVPQNVRQCQEFLPQAYEIPKGHQRRLRESNQLEEEIDLDELARYKKVYFQQPISPVGEIIKDQETYPYLVILGDPGSGKSTLLQYLALNWANLSPNDAKFQPIPLLIELRTYTRDRNSGKCKDFLEFFHNGNVICHLNQHELHERLKAGKVLVMFDGLDEVFEPVQRDEVITDIHRFTNDYPKVRVIVTSRVIGYKAQRLRDAQFSHFLLQDLEPEQIQDFIHKWHELTFADEADKVRKRERLQRAIKTSKAIGELAGNPLLLTMMAILNRNQELPKDRSELYKQASRVLLHQWDVERKLLEDPKVDAVTIDYKDKQAMLRQVAYFMQAADKGLAGNLIRKEDLERILIGYLKSIEVSQERRVARLLIEQLRTRNFILCFLGADSYGFVHRTFLEYFCASEFFEQFGKRGLEGGLTIEELKTEVFGKHWQDESWHEVLRLIVGMIDTSFAGEIIDYLMDLDGEEEKFINLFLAAECLLDVRNPAAIASIADKLLEQLQGLMNYGTLILSPRTDRDIEHYIRDIRDIRVTKIRTQAVASVATIWKDDPNTLAILKQQAQQNNDWVVRSAALRELARGWKDDPNTLAILKQRVKEDDDEMVRSVALLELACGWKDDPDTLAILKQRVKEDDDTMVRSAALRELALGWKDEPWLFELLCSIAVNDPFEREKNYQDNPRQLALELIIKQYPNHLQTLSLLKDRADNDPDEKVREFAKEKLEQLERQN
ncbi:HEAT repeat domain-containing protein [Lyngbya aestuarii]|uniref:HEAT repeat domain-containing protein n=1 Tax=Lyngbya aestuarii TaxID=118322 RepID=UPI00403D9313